MNHHADTVLAVSGAVAADSDGTMLVLAERLDGHDTFLTARLDLDDDRTVTVRILTLDDVTVLRLADGEEAPDLATSWAGRLHLPHGLRPRSIPEDLATAAVAANRDIGALDTAELRYALTFLGEATTASIRIGRIAAIVSALPVMEGSPHE